MDGKKDSSPVWNGLIYGAALAAAVGLKYHYSASGASGIRWMLAPLACLVGALTGIRFEWEPDAGYMGASAGIVIAPACAGINFLVICFSALFFTLAHRIQGIRLRFAWLVLTLAAACGVTLFANSTRIITSIYLYSADIYGMWITPERIHRLNGVVVYACFLIAAYLPAERLTRRPPGGPLAHPCRFISAVRVLSAPFLWYIFIAILVPVAGGGVWGEGRFIEHALAVLAALACLFVFSVAGAVLYHKTVDRFLDGSKNNRSRSLPGTATRSQQVKETGEPQ